MENIQRVWILYVIVLSLNCLMAEEGATAAKRHLIINAAELIQHMYFQNALTSKFKSKGMLLWRRGNEKLWIHSGLRKIRFDQEKVPEESLIGANGPDDPAFQGTSVGVPLNSASRTVSRLLAEMIKPCRIFHSGLDHN